MPYPVKAEITDNACRVLEARYLCRDKQGQIVETPEDMFRRVAHHVAQVETKYQENQAVRAWEERFYDALVRLDFLPNSPTLMNAGLPLGQLSACFVLPVGDSMEEIFDALKHMALIQQSGGGTGFSFSRLRPKGDVVSSTSGRSSGPVSFMRIFDCATENVRQGGKRRGAGRMARRPTSSACRCPSSSCARPRSSSSSPLPERSRSRRSASSSARTPRPPRPRS